MVLLRSPNMNVGKSKQMLLTVLAIALIAALVFVYFRTSRKEGFEGGATVTYFYLPQCPWCQKFEPEWNRFEEDARKEVGIQTAKVNGEEDHAAASAKGVKGYPTVIITKNGKDTEYKGERTAAALMAAVKSA